MYFSICHHLMNSRKGTPTIQMAIYSQIWVSSLSTLLSVLALSCVQDLCIFYKYCSLPPGIPLTVACTTWLSVFLSSWRAVLHPQLLRAACLLQCITWGNLLICVLQLFKYSLPAMWFKQITNLWIYNNTGGNILFCLFVCFWVQNTAVLQKKPVE